MSGRTVLVEERISRPYTPENLKATAELWDEDRVRKWFGIDNTKVFFYVQQVAAYQGVIDVEPEEINGFMTLTPL
jgi:hypothetical protein